MLDRRTFTASVLLSGIPLTGTAQTWPNKPIRLVVPYPAGGSTDMTGRLLAQHLSQQLGVPVPVENVAGVGGVLGSDQVRRSPPDGYTLLLGSSASHSVNMVTLKSNPYDPVTDFAPLMLVNTYANAVFVPASSPIRTLADLETTARKSPAGLTYATAGPGSSSYLTGELLRYHARLNMTPVHYKGIGPAMQDVMAGHVPVGFGDVVALTPHLSSGRLRILAVGSARRAKAMPDVPAIAETYAGFESVAWLALYAAKGTPDTILRRLHAESLKALHSPDVRSKLEASSAEIVAGSPEELVAFMRTDIRRWSDLAQNLKLVFE